VFACSGGNHLVAVTLRHSGNITGSLFCFRGLPAAMVSTLLHRAAPHCTLTVSGAIIVRATRRNGRIVSSHATAIVDAIILRPVIASFTQTRVRISPAPAAPDHRQLTLGLLALERITAYHAPSFTHVLVAHARPAVLRCVCLSAPLARRKQRSVFHRSRRLGWCAARAGFAKRPSSNTHAHRGGRGISLRDAEQLFTRALDIVTSSRRGVGYGIIGRRCCRRQR